MSDMNETKLLEYLILDAGALIKGYGLNLYTKSKQIITVPEVISEIRDHKARDLLEKLPFDIVERIPSQESVNLVVQFAKKTGDFAALSKTDIRLIALTYMIHVELHGSKDIMKLPVRISDSISSSTTTTTTNRTMHNIIDADDTNIVGNSKIIPLANSIIVGKNSNSNSWVKIVNHNNHQISSSVVDTLVVHTTIEEQQHQSNDETFEDVLALQQQEENEDHLHEEDEDSNDDDDSENDNDNNDDNEEDDSNDDEEEEDNYGEQEEYETYSQREYNKSKNMKQNIIDSETFFTTTNFPVMSPTSTTEYIAEKFKHLSFILNKKEKLDNSNSNEWDNIPIEASYITSLDPTICDCNTTLTNHQHHIIELPNKQQQQQQSQLFPTTTATRSSDTWNQSRMMKPSGLGTGNNAISTAAENKKMSLEDDGVGWINNNNFIQYKGNSSNIVNIRNKNTSNTKKDNNNNITSDKKINDESFSKVINNKNKITNNDNKKKTLKIKKIKSDIACLTTDFSMQNVLLQMNLQVLSVDGLLIRTAKQWVLRCMGCYTIHYDMDRLFCSKCGGYHLSRVSASIDAGGKLELHLKKNYRIDLRGTKYSLPSPGKQGRYEGELLLREDQLLHGIWKQKCVKIRKDIKSAFGEDVTSDVGIHINKSPAIRIGLGKQNPNAKKGRERRGKKKN